MRRLFGVVAWVLFTAAALAGSPVSISVVDLPAELAQGTSARVSFTLQLLDPAVLEDEDRGVWFLNIVEPLGGGDVRQVSHLLFSAASEESQIFRRRFSTDELQAGVSTQIEFQLRARPPLGDYLLALQLFKGADTNPGRVQASNRVAMEFFPFRVVEPD